MFTSLGTEIVVKCQMVEDCMLFNSQVHEASEGAAIVALQAFCSMQQGCRHLPVPIDGYKSQHHLLQDVSLVGADVIHLLELAAAVHHGRVI